MLSGSTGCFRTAWSPTRETLRPNFVQLTDEYRKIESGLADPAVVYSMADVDPGKDYPILIGGQARSPADRAASFSDADARVVAKG